MEYIPYIFLEQYVVNTLNRPQSIRSDGELRKTPLNYP